jgi:hypothetical protein
MNAWLILALLAGVLAWLLLAGQRRRRAPGPAQDRDDDARGDHTDRSDEPVGVIAIEDSIDLHGFRPREIPSVVESYLEAAAEKGLREVRLVHGRGKGVQRHRVQQILAAHPLVERFVDAPAHRGGWGATVAWLRPPDDSPQARRPEHDSRERRLRGR